MFNSGTSPTKRKCEEYQDPDYAAGEKLSASTEDRVRDLVNQEFKSEIELKTRQLDTVNSRLARSKQLLNRLRRKIVRDYYHKPKEPVAAVGRVNNPVVHHPTFAKLHGKRPCSPKAPTERKVKEAPTIERSSFSGAPKDEVPARSELNTRRLNNKVKHSIVVGNTSKFVGAAKGSAEYKKLSYKWVIYVKSQDALLESCVKKVRFYLDPSYGPNNMVDMYAPPFQVSRYGWGEFPVRVKLFFHGHLQQKPLQLIHNLVLDKTLSGMHTMGAETIADIWLPYRANDSEPKVEIKAEQSSIENEASGIKLEAKFEMKSSCVRDVASPRKVYPEPSKPPVAEAAAEPTKQESLLKPQLQLLRQSAGSLNVIYQSLLHDHDYISGPQTVRLMGTTANVLQRSPQLHFGVRQKRIDALNARRMLLRQQRKFEFDFQRQTFASVLEAVEFLLRRFPVVRPNLAAASAPSLFVNCMKEDFQALSAIGQKSGEWLRAKWLKRFLHQHKDLQRIQATEDIWTTREIVIFARHHGYTPPLKIHENTPRMPLQKFEPGTSLIIAPDSQFYTSWIADTTNHLRQFEHIFDSDDPIDVVNVAAAKHESRRSSIASGVPQSQSNLLDIVGLLARFRNVRYLENELVIISETCTFLRQPVSTEDEPLETIAGPLAVVLAQCLHIFVSKLLRRSVALKIAATPSLHDLSVNPSDIGSVLEGYEEFDFLRNGDLTRRINSK